MKICIVSLNIVPYFQDSADRLVGGAEVQAGVLAKAFSAAGADVNLVVADLSDGVDLPFPAHNAFYTASGLPVLRFLHPRTTGLLAALDRADADVYFQHCAGCITGMTSWFCRKHGKAFVYYAGSDSDFSYRDVIIENPRDKLLYFWGVKRASGVAVQNDRQARLCRTRLGREPRVIPTATDPVEVDEGDKDGSVVWVGSLRAVKRPDLFLELARRLPDRRFVLVGGGTATERSYAQRILDEAGRLENVTAPGRVPPREAERLLARAALLVNTSEFEGFPNAFLQAWARLAPVLSFVDVDGLIQGESVGLLCRDLDDMTAQAKRLLNDDDARRDMGRNARRLIEKRYVAPVAAQQHLAFFRELLQNK